MQDVPWAAQKATLPSPLPNYWPKENFLWELRQSGVSGSRFTPSPCLHHLGGVMSAGANAPVFAWAIPLGDGENCFLRV